VGARGETRVAVVEQKCYEECTAAPAPDADVIVAAVLVVWTDTLITTLKMVRKEDWPVAHSAYAWFKTMPDRSEVTILLESDDVAAALVECERMEQQHLDMIKHANSPQWKESLLAWKNKRIQGSYRKFVEVLDADFIKMRMVAIWDAQETMECGVSERDDASNFLA
jgi:hypothetical protein